MSRRKWTGAIPGDVEAAIVGLEIYRVQDEWRWRRGVPVRAARRWWCRTWQAEWDGCRHAPRAFTRNGVLVKSVRTRMRAARS